MDADQTRRLIETQIANQTKLAAMCTCDAVRAMHHDLASLYRSQLMCIVLDEQLAIVNDIVCFDLAA